MSNPDAELIATYKRLVSAAAQAAKNAYAPYSHEPRGAALLTQDGQIICGVTVEIATFGASIAAEINAVCQAVALGHRHFKAIAIAPYSNPSGNARQFIAEFGINVDLVMGTEEGVQVISLKELLPLHFGPDNMGDSKVKGVATSGGAL